MIKWCRIVLSGYGKVTEAMLQVSDGFKIDDNGVMLQVWKDHGPIPFVVNPDGSITVPYEEIKKAMEV